MPALVVPLTVSLPTAKFTNLLFNHFLFFRYHVQSIKVLRCTYLNPHTCSPSLILAQTAFSFKLIFFLFNTDSLRRFIKCAFSLFITMIGLPTVPTSWTSTYKHLVSHYSGSIFFFLLFFLLPPELVLYRDRFCISRDFLLNHLWRLSSFFWINNLLWRLVNSTDIQLLSYFQPIYLTPFTQ